MEYVALHYTKKKKYFFVIHLNRIFGLGSRAEK